MYNIILELHSRIFSILDIDRVIKEINGILMKIYLFLEKDNMNPFR
jgi:hypothetical protein